MISVYVHIPFCVKRCAYCDFVTYTGMDELLMVYADAISKEISLVTSNQAEKMQLASLYFGGGTPSLLPFEGFKRIFESIHDCFEVIEDAEITVEANPGTVRRHDFTELVALGVNRISLGVQSLNPDDLRKLGRIHDVHEVFASIRAAHQAGIKNISLDLIFGLPWQDLASWKKTLRNALLFKPQHISLYALTLEENTPLAVWIEKGFYNTPNEDEAADMYEYAMVILASAGYQQYEISNWSKGELFASKHNMQYWLNNSYLGFGAGAHSSANHYRLENLPGIKDYIDALQVSNFETIYPFSPANTFIIKNDRFTEMQETMMLGLRLVKDGVSNHSFYQRYGSNINDVFEQEIAELHNWRLVEWVKVNNDIRLRLTKKGTLLGNQVFIRFVGEPDK